MTAPEPGPLGEEAARLVAALGEWLGERVGPLASAAQSAAQTAAARATGEGDPDGPLPWWASRQAQSSPGAAPTGAAHGPDCRYCPVCQLIGHVRALRPEVAEHLADAAAALTAAFRAAAEGTGAAGRPTRVEHIDIA